MVGKVKAGGSSILRSRRCDQFSWQSILSLFSPMYFCRFSQLSDCGKYLILTIQSDSNNNLLYFADLENAGEIRDKLPIRPIVTEFEAQYEVRYNFDRLIPDLNKLSVCYFYLHFSISRTMARK